MTRYDGTPFDFDEWFDRTWKEGRQVIRRLFDAQQRETGPRPLRLPVFRGPGRSVSRSKPERGRLPLQPSGAMIFLLTIYDSMN